MRRLGPLLLTLALAGCGGGGSSAVSGSSTAAPPIRVTLHAATHRPLVGKPWPYTVRVTDAAGHPLRARITMRVVFGGAPVGKVDGGKTFTFVGTWREPKGSPVIWPKRSRGYPLTFEAIVTANGQTRKVDWWVRPS